MVCASLICPYTLHITKGITTVKLSFYLRPAILYGGQDTRVRREQYTPEVKVLTY